VYGDGTVLAELLLRFMNLPDEVDEPLAGLGDSLFRPVGEVELSDRSRLSVLDTHRVNTFEVRNQRIGKLSF